MHCNFLVGLLFMYRTFNFISRGKYYTNKTNIYLNWDWTDTVDLEIRLSCTLIFLISIFFIFNITFTINLNFNRKKTIIFFRGKRKEDLIFHICFDYHLLQEVSSVPACWILCCIKPLLKITSSRLLGCCWVLIKHQDLDF